MAWQSPSAPQTFYDPSLTTMQTACATDARLVLIDSEVLNPNSCWAAVGVGDDSDDVAGTNIGTGVLAFADLGAIPVLSDSDLEDDPDEPGRKLVFDAIANMPVVQTKSGTAVSAAIVKNVATFGAGANSDVLYIIDMQDQAVDGSGGGVTINTPSFDIEIAYAITKI